MAPWAERERLLGAFEEAWRAGRRPTLADHLPEGPDRTALLAELVHLDLEYRLRRREPVRVEAYLREYPELAADLTVALGLIAWAFDLDRRFGPGATVAEYVARFPEYRTELLHRLRPAPPESVPTPTVPEAPAGPARGASEGRPAVPGYEVYEEVGRGGMGVVYRARHTALKRTVALKLFRADVHPAPQDLARFRAEAEAAARLHHPNIVEVYEVGDLAGGPASRCWMALEFVGAASLAQKLRAEPQPPHEAARLVETLARAMGYAHRQGIVHRDLKPANILLTADGTPKVADFGLAKRLDVDTGQTASGSLLGTPCYMAPEQALGRTGAVGPAADVYALGAILYELLTGRPPFKGTTLLETLEQVRTRDPLPPGQLQPKVPRDLETVCLKCLEKDPRRRYAAAEDLADDLLRFLNNEPIRARRVGPVERARKWLKRRPLWAALLGVCLAAALSLSAAGVSLWRTARSLDQALHSATAEQHRAQENEARALQHLYATDLWRAQQLWDAGDVNALRDVLDRHRPGRDPDPPGFEWQYYQRLAQGGDPWTLPVPESEVDVAAFSPDGRTLATAGRDGTVRLWDVATQRERASVGESPGPVARLAFLNDGTLAAVGEAGGVRLWDVARGQERPTALAPPEGVRLLTLSPDGRLMAGATADANVRVWEAATGRPVSDLGEQVAGVEALAFARSRPLLAGAAGDGSIRVWDLEAGKELFTFRQDGGVTALAFSHGGRLLAAGGRTGVVRLFNVAPAGRDAALGPLSDLRAGHAGAVRCLAFSGDDDRFASGSDDGTVRLWACDTPAPRNVFRGHTDRVVAVAFSPDGPALLSTGADGAVIHWDEGRKQDCDPVATPLRPAGPLAFTAAGRALAVLGRDRAVHLLDAVSGEPRGGLSGPPGAVRALAAAPSGDLLATGGTDGTVKVWGADGRPRATLAPPDVPLCLAFSRDGRALAAGLNDGRLAVWDTATGPARRLARPRRGSPGRGVRPGRPATGQRRHGPVRALLRHRRGPGPGPRPGPRRGRYRRVLLAGRPAAGERGGSGRRLSVGRRRRRAGGRPVRPPLPGDRRRLFAGREGGRGGGGAVGPALGPAGAGHPGRPGSLRARRTRRAPGLLPGREDPRHQRRATGRRVVGHRDLADAPAARTTAGAGARAGVRAGRYPADGR
jgi:serine/threonine protein kinase/WD40 repeat protein